MALDESLYDWENGGKLKDEKWTLGDMAQYIEDLEDLISEAAPLTWIGHENIDAAQLWEIRAYDLINKV